MKNKSIFLSFAFLLLTPLRAVSAERPNQIVEKFKFTRINAESDRLIFAVASSVSDVRKKVELNEEMRLRLMHIVDGIEVKEFTTRDKDSFDYYLPEVLVLRFYIIRKKEDFLREVSLLFFHGEPVLPKKDAFSEVQLDQLSTLLRELDELIKTHVEGN